mmetsp:Transcript_39398/g.93366  ORF Transcript_39398/g.93366 Transcript_39398/m.93366 type:complete len:209 (-) Transcript_39398:1393-2019(-)
MAATSASSMSRSPWHCSCSESLQQISSIDSSRSSSALAGFSSSQWLLLGSPSDTVLSSGCRDCSRARLMFESCLSTCWLEIGATELSMGDKQSKLGGVLEAEDVPPKGPVSAGRDLDSRTSESIGTAPGMSIGWDEPWLTRTSRERFLSGGASMSMMSLRYSWHIASSELARRDGSKVSSLARRSSASSPALRKRLCSFGALPGSRRR